MKPKLCFFLFLAFLLTGCIPGTGGVLEVLPEISAPVNDIRTLHVDVDAGTLNLKQTNDSMVRLAGMAPLPQKTIPDIVKSQNTLSINIPPGSSPESVYALEIPTGVEVSISSNSANINLNGFKGNISVDCISGNIAAKKITGNTTLRSGRGNITLSESSGEIHILGEHGMLSLTDIHGLVTSSTIMGTISFNGSPAATDNVNLETDHGPIIVKLGQDSNTTYSANSASGEITCTLPGVNFLPRGCYGEISNGIASLQIRTVSGIIKLSIAQ